MKVYDVRQCQLIDEIEITSCTTVLELMGQLSEYKERFKDGNEQWFGYEKYVLNIKDDEIWIYNDWIE